MHVLYPMLVRPFPYMYKTSARGGNPYMATVTIYHSSHTPGDGLVVSRLCRILAHSFGGLWPEWRASPYITSHACETVPIYPHYI